MKVNSAVCFGPNTSEGRFDPSKGQWLHPVQLGADTLYQLSVKRETVEHVLEVLERLEEDPYIAFVKQFYQAGLEKFGELWRYTDQLTVLHAAAVLLKPETYLEIGVFRGRSMAVVTSAVPDCRVYGFDMWIENYSGLENVGPELVRAQLERAGYRGEATLVSGNSQATVPEALEANPDLFFDLVTVDGDHTEEGARIDIEHVLPRVKIGGAIVFDDISHPSFPWLERVWDTLIGGNPNFVSAKYTQVGHGVAFAIRHSFDATLDNIKGSAAEREAQLSVLFNELRVQNETLNTALTVREEYEDSLRQTLEAKDDYILSLQEALDQKETALHETIQQLQADSSHFHTSLQESETYAQSLRRALESVEHHASTLQATTEEHAHYIQSLQVSLEKKDEYIGSLQSTVQSREEELQNAHNYILSLQEHLNRALNQGDTAAQPQLKHK